MGNNRKEMAHKRRITEGKRWANMVATQKKSAKWGAIRLFEHAPMSLGLGQVRGN
jgi:hypothetical protein